jgi:hypothetical protein
MRRVLTPAHATFSAANRTITFATTVPASIGHILRVVNLTRATVYFDPTAESGLGYLSSATYASPVLTLRVNTDGHANGDVLFIEYDDGLGATDVNLSGPVTVSNEVEIKNDSGSPIPVADAGSSLTVDSKAYRAAVTISRPSNTTGYTAGDVIGVADGTTPANAGSAIITLPSIGPSGGYVLLQSVRLMIGNTSVPSGMSGFRLHLYTASPTAILDNAAFNLASGEVASYAGYVDLPTPQDLGSTLFAQADYPGTLIKLAAASTTLYAELETRGTYTPASGTLYDLRVLAMEAGL